MLQCAVLLRPIILAHVENGPCDKFDLLTDIKFIYIIFMYLKLQLFYLTTCSREIVVPSKLSTPRLLGDSVLWRHIPLQ